MRISLEPAYVLHHRPWRDSSLILDLLTPAHGRIAVVARGARRPKSRLQGLLQPFRPLLVSASGRGEMATLTGAELQGETGRPMPLQGRTIISGFYLNELLVRLLERHDPHPRLYAAYEQTLAALAGSPAAGDEQRALRRFEHVLLGEIGYGLVLDHDVASGAPIDAATAYDYHPERGPVAAATAFTIREADASAPEAVRIHGRSLIALAQDRLDSADMLREARQLMRMTLGICLGRRPLHSRALFRLPQPPGGAEARRQAGAESEEQTESNQ